ncbi:hypothetical protein ACFQV8_19850 [Pseudonocardia benzenivorans]
MLDRDHAQQQRRPQREPGDQRRCARAEPEQARVPAGGRGERRVGGLDPGDGAGRRAVRGEVGGTVQGVDECRRQLGAGRGLPGAGGPAQRRRDDRHDEAPEHQAGGEHEPARDEQRRRERHGAGAGQQRRQRRRQATDEQVLGRVGVAHQPGDEVGGPEPADRLGAGESLVDPHPDVGEGPQRGVVGDQPLQVAGEAAGDAEGAGQHDRDRQRRDRRVRGRGGDEPGGEAEQAGPRRRRHGTGEHPQREPGAPRPGEGEHAAQWVPHDATPCEWRWSP